MVEEARRDAEVAQRYVDPRVAQRLGDGRTDAAGPAVVLDGDDDAVLLGERGSASSTGLTQRGSTTVVEMPCVVEQLGDLQAHRGERADGDQQHVGPAVVRRCAARPCRRPGRRPATAGPTAPLEKRTTVGASSTSTASRSWARTWSASRGAAIRRPGTHLQDRHVPHAVVRGAVGAGDAGPVQDEGDAALVQRHVHQDLVEGAVEEGGVDREDRVQPAGGQARRGDGAVLLGDADVVDPVGERLGELVRPTGLEHRGGDGDDVRRAPCRA